MREPSFANEGILWMSFTVVLLFASPILIIEARRDATTSSRRLNIMFEREADLRSEISSLNATIQDVKSAPLNEYERKELKKRGLKNPAVDLFSDLIKHENLLPNKGAVGGRAGYYDPVASRVLNGRWFLGVFWKGNSLKGESLLQYKVSKAGKISWRLVDAYWEDRTGRSGELSMF